MTATFTHSITLADGTIHEVTKPTTAEALQAVLGLYDRSMQSFRWDSCPLRDEHVAPDVRCTIPGYPCRACAVLRVQILGRRIYVSTTGRL